MPMLAPEIEARIKAAFPDATVVLVDLAGDGDHWAARVTSAAFAGKSRILLIVAENLPAWICVFLLTQFAPAPKTPAC